MKSKLGLVDRLSKETWAQYEPQHDIFSEFLSAVLRIKL